MTNMKSAGEISKKVLNQGSQESKPKSRFSELDIERMRKTFEFLAAEFPRFLPSNDKDLKKKRDLWMALLKNIDDKARGKALEMVFRDINNRGGPTISEFLKRCRTEKAHKPFRKLLPAPQNECIARAELDKMLKKLKG